MGVFAQRKKKTQEENKQSNTGGVFAQRQAKKEEVNASSTPKITSSAQMFMDNEPIDASKDIQLNTLSKLKPKVMPVLKNETFTDKTANTLGATAMGILDAGTFGARERAMQTQSGIALPNEQLIKDDNKAAYWIGERIGENVNPVGLGLNKIAIGKNLSLGKTMLAGGGLGAGQGALEEGVRSAVRGDDLKTVGKNTLGGAIGGGVGGAVFSGLGKAIGNKLSKPITNSVDNIIDENKLYFDEINKYNNFRSNIKNQPLALPEPNRLALPEPAIQMPPVPMKARTLSNTLKLNNVSEKKLPMHSGNSLIDMARSRLNTMTPGEKANALMGISKKKEGDLLRTPAEEMMALMRKANPNKLNKTKSILNDTTLNINAYHGSPNAKIISELKPSKNGELGAGFYFTKDKDYANAYTRESFEGISDNAGVLEMNIDNLKIKEITKSDYLTERNKLYDIERTLNNGNWNSEVAKRAEEKLIKKYINEGYDGLHVEGEKQGVVFPNSVSKIQTKEQILAKQKFNTNLLNKLKIEHQSNKLPKLPIKNNFKVSPEFAKDTPFTVFKGNETKNITPKQQVKVSMPMKGRNAKTNEFKEIASKWQDKSMLSLKRETPERNFEDIMGKDAPQMIKKYLDPVHVNESEATRFKKIERESVKNLGIKYGSKEDALVQKYGEGKITLDELKTEAPKTWQNVVKATETFRKKYDTFLDTINTALTRNGYAPIPKRKDYFPHMEEVDSILKQFGMGMDNLPTDIAGLSADFKPGKNFFANALRRKGDKTKFSAIEGFDRYIEGASKLIYHTDDIKRLRNLEKTIRSEFAETNHLSNFVSDLTDYTNNLAGKKAMADRGIENIVGRNIYGVVDKIRQRVAANMIGGNISSAITNFIPLTQSLATTEKVPFIKGMMQILTNTLKDDGFINKSDFLTRRFGSDRIALNKTQKATEFLNKPFKYVDSFVSQAIVRGKYLEGIEKGLSESQALKQADNWAARIMADRSLGATPTLFNSKTLAPLTQFQIEVNNQLSFMFKDMPRNLNKAKLTSAAIQLSLYSYLFNNVYEMAIGRRPAFDPVGVILNAKEDYEKLDTKKATSNLLTNVSNQLPFSSLITEGGRLPITAGIPNLIDVAKGESKLSKEIAKPLTYLALPTGGGQVKKTYEGVKNLLKKGVYEKGKDGEYLKYPIEDSLTNKIKAPLFGTNSLKETRDYYGNNRRPLSSGQTEKFKKESVKTNQEDVYNSLLEKREIEKQIDAINADSTLTKQQKQVRTAPLHAKLKAKKFKWLENKK